MGKCSSSIFTFTPKFPKIEFDNLNVIRLVLSVQIAFPSQ